MIQMAQSLEMDVCIVGVVYVTKALGPGKSELRRAAKADSPQQSSMGCLIPAKALQPYSFGVMKLLRSSLCERVLLAEEFESSVWCADPQQTVPYFDDLHCIISFP